MFTRVDNYPILQVYLSRFNLFVTTLSTLLLLSFTSNLFVNFGQNYNVKLTLFEKVKVNPLLQDKFLLLVLLFSSSKCLKLLKLFLFSSGK